MRVCGCVWVRGQIALRGHCSGFIKVTGNYSNLFAGHSSWFTYASMLRIYKHYDLALGTAGSNAKMMSFSSCECAAECSATHVLPPTALSVRLASVAIPYMTAAGCIG